MIFKNNCEQRLIDTLRKRKILVAHFQRIDYSYPLVDKNGYISTEFIEEDY